MRNIVIIGVIVVSIGYMFSILFTKYETIKATSNKNNTVNQKSAK